MQTFEDRQAGEISGSRNQAPCVPAQRVSSIKSAQLSPKHTRGWHHAANSMRLTGLRIRPKIHMCPGQAKVGWAILFVNRIVRPQVFVSEVPPRPPTSCSLKTQHSLARRSTRKQKHVASATEILPYSLILRARPISDLLCLYPSCRRVLTGLRNMISSGSTMSWSP